MHFPMSEISDNISYDGISVPEKIQGVWKKEIFRTEALCSVPVLSRHYQAQSIAIQPKSV